MVERLPLRVGVSGLEGGIDVEEVLAPFFDEGWRPPTVWRDSAVEVLSGPSSGSESSSNMVFRFAGGGLEDREGGVLVMLRP